MSAHRPWIHTPATSLPAETRSGGSRAEPLLRAGGALLLVAGSALFLGGGRSHPGIDPSLAGGAGGFFGAFAATVHGTTGWHGMHLLILLGPLFWAAGAPLMLDGLRPGGGPLARLVQSTLLLSAGLWGVAFVLDGFGAPVYAEALASADSAEVREGVLTAFQANAVMMSRMGLVAWVAGGVGMMVLGGALLAPGVRSPWRAAVGALGLAIGAFPLLAALEGEYAAGPFTSRFWMPNALAVGLWFLALASCALERRARP